MLWALASYAWMYYRMNANVSRIMEEMAEERTAGFFSRSGGGGGGGGAGGAPKMHCLVKGRDAGKGRRMQRVRRVRGRVGGEARGGRGGGGGLRMLLCAHFYFPCTCYTKRGLTARVCAIQALETIARLRIRCLRISFIV